MFVAYSCKQRCTCPSCHQKRALLTALHVADEVCSPVAHRQVVLTIPKRLRLHTRFDRRLLGQLCCCAARCLQTELQRLLGRHDVMPGLIAAVQTHGELLHWHPHIHMLVTCGAFSPEGKFLDVAELHTEALRTAWQEAVFALYLAEEKIDPEVVENMRTWPHSGFSVDQSVFLPAGDGPGIERLVGYMTRCPFSLSRLVKVSKTGQVIYKAEKETCRAFPDPRALWKKGTGTVCRNGPKGATHKRCLSRFSRGRNFQLLDPLDFLAEFTQHIPPKGTHLIRYYGWYSNKARGLRKKATAEAATRQPVAEAPTAEPTAASSVADAALGTAPALGAGLPSPPRPLGAGLPTPAIPGSQVSSEPPATGPCAPAAALPPRRRCSPTWAMLIKRVDEVDPLACPKCGGQMKVIAFIEPPQAEVIEKILRHCGLWNPPLPRPPPADDPSLHDPHEARELSYVDIETFEASF